MSLDVYLKLGRCEKCGRGSTGEVVFNSNITHNLNRMAEEAGVYKHLWRPEEIGIATAKDLIEPLAKAVELMEREPERFKAFNATNGWGLYEHFVPWVKEYLEACRRYPEAQVEASR